MCFHQPFPSRLVLVMTEFTPYRSTRANAESLIWSSALPPSKAVVIFGCCVYPTESLINPKTKKQNKKRDPEHERQLPGSFLAEGRGEQSPLRLRSARSTERKQIQRSEEEKNRLCELKTTGAPQLRAPVALYARLYAAPVPALLFSGSWSC